ncbi:hypothetical protein Skr01_04720 [Sphaerisporangium krabiense]|uniref:WXG100 family type VII secretion target n=1 Tax=Sphaerisporangium krabiense TaxID=763782 RepID=A0A7W8Z7A7_9ACTN|nr:hypothetical protein [Sphaerisporangium krabiense]MBB5628771.1 hypothetical protein [Sphaerisporangium krabiense]GII60387.1 hypothetical protein Skr01_04720 [Sphaerisporangium krabiense]
MSYENGVTLHTIGLAGMAAFALLNPRGWPVFLMAGASLGNSGDMDKAARDWHSVAADFDGLVTELTNLTNGVPDDKWTAEDRQAFEASVAAFKKELKKSGAVHAGVGDSMDNLAKLYYAFSLVVFSVGGILLALVGAVAAAMATGVGAAPAQAAAGAIATGLEKVVAAAQKHKMAALVAATVLLGGVYTWNQSKQGELQQKGMNPSGGGQPMFTQVATLNLTTGDGALPGTGTLPALPGLPADGTVPGVPRVN